MKKECTCFVYILDTSHGNSSQNRYSNEGLICVAPNVRTREYEAAERIEKFFVGIESEACYSFGFIIFKWEKGGVEIEI
jgi:hypothetical protein